MEEGLQTQTTEELLNGLTGGVRKPNDISISNRAVMCRAPSIDTYLFLITFPLEVLGTYSIQITPIFQHNYNPG